MKTLFRKIRLIHRSRKNYKKELEEHQIKKLDICNKCPLNSENNKTSKSTLHKILNNFLNYLYSIKVDEDATCNKCGCNIVLKTKYDKCDLWK